MPDRRDSTLRPTRSDNAGRSQNTSSSQPADVLPQTLGKYRVQRRLGQGGMATIYLGIDPDLHRQVALKAPRLGDENRAEALERFWREARAIARIRHPNICPIHDVVEADGVVFIVMDYIDGVSLADYASRATLLAPRDAAEIVRKIAVAMREAHRLGLIHRDLKPGNVIIDQRGEPIVMDFGIAIDPRRGGSRITSAGAIVGTPAYMAPEQIDGDVGVIGPATDIYSLGVLFYELLTARLPFEGDATAVLVKVMTAQPLPPSRYRPEIDAALERICMTAMSRHPLDRFESMAELADQIERYLRPSGESSRSAPTGQPPRPVGRPRSASSAEFELPDRDTVTGRVRRTDPDRPKTTGRTTSRNTASRRPPSAPAPRRSSADDVPLDTLFRALLATGFAVVCLVAVLVGARQLLRTTGVEAVDEAPVVNAAPAVPAAPAVDVAKLPSAADGIGPKVDHATIPAKGNLSIQVDFEPLDALDGQWAITRSSVFIDQTSVLNEDHPLHDDWRLDPATARTRKVVPVFSFDAELIPSVERAAGKTVDVVVSLRVAYPKVVDATSFADTHQDLRRKFRLTVVDTKKSR